MNENENDILLILEFLWRIDKIRFIQILIKDALFLFTFLFHLEAFFKKLLKYILIRNLKIFHLVFFLLKF